MSLSKLLCLKALATFDREVQNLPWFALGEHIEGAATNLAVGGEPLAGDARVENEIKLLAAIRTLDGCGTFHVLNEWVVR